MEGFLPGSTFFERLDILLQCQSIWTAHTKVKESIFYDESDFGEQDDNFASDYSEDDDENDTMGETSSSDEQAAPSKQPIQIVLVSSWLFSLGVGNYNWKKSKQPTPCRHIRMLGKQIGMYLFLELYELLKLLCHSQVKKPSRKVLR